MPTRHSFVPAVLLPLAAVACSSGSAPPRGTLELGIDANAPVVVRQVYGGGANSGAPYTHDFIELFNRSDAPVSLSGWSLQFASATGTGNFGANDTQITELSDVTLAPGQSFLVQGAMGSSGTGVPLPAADLIDPTPINISATAGKVALVRQATSLGCNGSAGQPCTPAAEAAIVDLIGFGNADYFEGAAAPAASNSTSLSRAGSGCGDTNDNSVDFSAGAPDPRNSSATAAPCDGSGGSGGAGGMSGSGGAGTGGGAGSGGSPEPGTVRIRDIQGAAHRSPLEGTSVSDVPGIVTNVRSNGFYFQDPTPDADEATSEALFVFTGSAPGVAAGDSVLVSGPVSEFRPGCSSCSPSSSAYPNLTATQIANPTSVFTVSPGNPLPPAILLGPGGRTSPVQVIDGNGAGDVERAASTFSPASDGIDFYESLEGMRVEIRDAVAVGPTNQFGELAVLVSGGAGAGLRTRRGGIVIAPGDFNPERVILDGDPMPAANVGDSFPGRIVAVVDYSFGNYKFLPTEPLPALVSGGLEPELSSLSAAAVNELTVASFNVENLDPSDPPAKFSALADLIVRNLGSPDLLALEEIQDDTGPTNDGTVSAGLTLSTLASAISAAGGPSYDWRSVDPVNGQDGGEPGANIRVAFLFRTDRGLSFVDRPGAGSTTANSVTGPSGAPALAYSPGRVDPTNGAFANSRKPLAGEFSFNGQTLFVIANHFNSKGGDHPLFGRFQPPVPGSEAQRLAQAAVVADFASQILSRDANSKLVVLGDLNDFQFSPPLATLTAAGLTSLVETLPESERYSYVFDGNSQVLDHVMASNGLLSSLRGFDVVHANAEFAVRTTDHDPALARFAIGPLPTLPLIPILECVEQRGFLSWIGRFGYDNPNGLAVSRAIGPKNRFVPAAIDRGQPTTFAPGRQRDVFEVMFHGGLAPWLLDGRPAPATVLAPRCP